jgi:hypothetical protein
MTRLRIARGLSSARRRGAKLAVLAAGLVALATFAPASAGAKLDPPNGARDGWPPPNWRRHGPGPAAPTNPLVNFRRNALFTCFGAAGGIATPSTARITATATTVTAMLRIVAPPGTVISGQLDQSGCSRLKFFTTTVGITGVATLTVTDLRVSNDAFVWIVGGVAGLQITPEVIF